MLSLLKMFTQSIGPLVTIVHLFKSERIAPSLILVMILSNVNLSLVAAEKPNVIVILVDDQGYYDLGCYGATEVKTPRIDELASEGIRFTDYYAAAPICSPSRAGLLTGCYPRRVGNHIWVHRADSKYGIHPRETTMAELFQQNGYATACVGKWHLGFRTPLLPQQQGFDEYFGLLHNLDPVEVVYFESEGGVPLLKNQEVVQRPADASKLTERYTDEAIRFIREHRDEPFFLYLPHTMLHHPLGVGESFRGSSNWGEYGDAIQEMDYHVGRLMDCLKETKVDERTLVIYLSDNGRGPGRNDSQPIRGRKLTTHEAGIRVPAICWGPALGITEGTETAEVISAMDWLPTVATMAGISVPEGLVVDGRDIAPLLKGQSEVVPDANLKQSLNAEVPLRRHWEPPQEWSELMTRREYHDAFFYHGSEGQLAAVRWKKWKLVLTPSLSLYDLQSDPSETKLVRNPEISRKLRGMAIVFQQEMRRDSRPPGVANTATHAASAVIDQELIQGLDQQLDVTYRQVGGIDLKLDLFRPVDHWGSLPLIVCIHGGGWSRGAKENHRAIAQALASKGFVTASINYRLSGDASFPAAIHDCKAAIRFLRSRADRFGIDAEKIGVTGHSAGGHLAALLGTSAGDLNLEGEDSVGSPSRGVSSAVQAVVAMGAQTDLLSQRVASVSAEDRRGIIWRQFLGGTQAEAIEAYRSASPLVHLDSSDPAFLFITGENDDVSTRAEDFRERLRELKISSDLVLITDAPHSFQKERVWFTSMISAATEFFRNEFGL